MFRPMMILGILVIALGFASYIFVPGWRTSPLGLLMIVILIGLGGYAFVRDAISFYNDMKQASEHRDESNDQEHKSDES